MFVRNERRARAAAEPTGLPSTFAPSKSLTFLWYSLLMNDHEVDPRILALCEKVKAKRPRTVIDHILRHGYVTTEELQNDYGYDHPPRAARDVRENGIPLETFRTTSTRTKRRIGAYRFGDPGKIRVGRIGGRKAFSKAFRDALIAHYNSRDSITGERMEARYLQIDHRVPYEVAGDIAHDVGDLGEYMLLDASNQRAKSWSCERCPNWQVDQDVGVCRSCFWAFPESYTHVAGKQVRRAIVEWRGDEVEVFEKLRIRAERDNISVPALIKNSLKY